MFCGQRIRRKVLSENMAAARIRNDAWKNDLELKEKLLCYIKQGLRRQEVLDFMGRDFDQYAWSMSSLDRRLRHFNINYTDTDVAVEDVVDTVRQEMDGPGKLLGYRAMYQKLRQVHDLRVPRDMVHAAMYFGGESSSF